jgi:hypothetical protein
MPFFRVFLGDVSPPCGVVAAGVQRGGGVGPFFAAVTVRCGFFGGQGARGIGHFVDEAERSLHDAIMIVR